MHQKFPLAFIGMSKKRSSEISLILIIGVFSLSKLNASNPYTEGWWSSYSQLLRNGLIPYKDFELLTPPGFVYVTNFFESIVGLNFFQLRLVGSFFQIIIALLIYRILLRRTNALISFCVTIFANIYLYSGVASITYDYNYFSIFLILIAFNLFESQYNRTPKTHLILLYSAGLFLGFSFLVKQSFASTTVFFLTITLFSEMLHSKTNTNSRQIRDLFLLISGFTTPIAIFTIYAFHGNFLDDLYRDIFRSSLSAKGDTRTILFGWFSNIHKYYSIKEEFLVFFILFVCIFLLRTVIQKGIGRNFALIGNRKLLSSSILSVAFSLLAISLCALLARAPLPGFDGVVRKSLAPILTLNHFVIPTFYLAAWVFLLVKEKNENYRYVFALNLGLLWGCAFSGGIDQYGIFLALALVIVMVLNFLSQNSSVTASVAIILAMWVAGFNSLWLANPYAWWGYQTASAYNLKSTSQFPFTKGLMSDLDSNYTYSQILNFVKTNRSCPKIMLTYSNMTSIGLDAGYTPYANQVQYWYDFISSRKVQEISEGIMENPPPVILYTNYPEYVSRFHSVLFNKNADFPQRKLEILLEDMITKDYNSRIFELAGSKDYSITIAVKQSCA